MKFNHRMMLLGAIAMAVGFSARTAAVQAVEDAQRSGKWDAGYGHGWRGKRHKLKRSRQNHQRSVPPSRRHAA